MFKKLKRFLIRLLGGFCEPINISPKYTNIYSNSLIPIKLHAIEKKFPTFTEKECKERLARSIANEFVKVLKEHNLIEYEIRKNIYDKHEDIYAILNVYVKIR